MQIITTAYGAPAADALVAELARIRDGSPLAPATIVVPTNEVGVVTRRRLARSRHGERTGIAGIHLLTILRLAETLGAPELATQGRRPVSTPVLVAAARAVLRTKPGRFAPVAGHPATEQALVDAYRELRLLAPHARRSLAAASTRAAEVVRTTDDMHRSLRADWYDETDLLEAAAGRTALAGAWGPVVVYVPQQLPQPAIELLSVLDRTNPVSVIVGLTGRADADAELVALIEQLPLDGEPSGPTPIPDLAAPHDLAVVSVSDPEEEVRAALREVVRAARNGTPLDRIALLAPVERPYLRLVHEHAAAAGLPTNGRAVRPLADRVVGRTLLDLTGLHERRYARDAVMNVLSAAPMHDPDGARLPVARWERLTREAGVVRDRHDWDHKLAAFADGEEQRAQREERSDAPDRFRVHAHRRTAAEAQACRRYVLALIDDLESGLDGELTWGALAQWARRLLHDRLRASSPGEWPQAERAAGEAVERSLRRLAVLDAIGDGATTLQDFRSTLELELDDDLGRSGRLGDGVTVTTLSGGLGVDADLVVVLGLAEGVLPARPHEDSLLSDQDRAATDGALRLRRDLVGRQHRQVLAALTDVERVVLTMPRGDMRTAAERRPSRWLQELVTWCHGPADPADPDADPSAGASNGIVEIPSFAASHRLEPATETDARLHVLAGGAPTADTLRGVALVGTDPALGAGTRLRLARRSDRFTRFDGDCREVAALLPDQVTERGHVLSPTQLETWATCPHAYLLRYLFRIEPVEAPEEIIEISPLDRGSLVHEVLERFVAEELDRTAPLVPPHQWDDDARARLMEIAEEVCDAYEDRGLTGFPAPWQRDRRDILSDLGRFVDEDNTRMRKGRLAPHSVELAFGLRHSRFPAAELRLDDGTSVRLAGKIDRIDMGDDGRIVVADYKTGGPDSSDRDFEAEPLARGQRLQLAVYTMGARTALEEVDAPVEAAYWYVTTNRGRFKWRPYHSSDAEFTTFKRVVATILAGVQSGLFPLHPDEPAWRLYTPCRYCDPDELGTAERHREWQRKRLDPAVRSYTRLAEHEVLADVELGDQLRASLAARDARRSEAEA